jgi:hypothetical protein
LGHRRLLRLVFNGMRQRTSVLKDLRWAPTVHPAAAGWTTHKMLDLVLGRIADAPADVFASGNVGHAVSEHVQTGGPD